MVKFVAGFVGIIFASAWFTDPQNVMTGVIVMLFALVSLGAGVLEIKS